MKRFTLLFLTTLLYSFSSSAQWTGGGTQLSFTHTQDVDMVVSPTPQGGYYITWQSDTSTDDFDTSGYDYIKINDYDSTGAAVAGWQQGGISITPPGVYYFPHVITSEDGNAIVSWYGTDTAHTNKPQNIYIQKYSSSGTPLWNGGNTIQLNNDNAHSNTYPLIISDKKKGVYITWTRAPFPFNPDSSFVFLQHIDSTGNIATGWNANGDEIAGKLYRQDDSHIALTKDLASIYVVYAAYPDSTHLIVNRFNTSDGSIASGWSSNGVSLAKGNLLDPRVDCNLWIYTDSIGNASILWLDAPPQYGVANWVLIMNQVSPSGLLKLSFSGKFIAGGPIDGNGIDYLEVQQDKEYNLLVTFNDRNTVDPNAVSTIDAYKVNPNGTTLWSKIDIVSYDYAYCPKAVPDGRNGMYIFYEDVNPPNPDSYNYNNLRAIALDSTGKIYSGANWSGLGPDFGVEANSGGFNPNYDFSTAYLGNGKAVVAWNRGASGINYAAFSLYACNLNKDGTICGNNISTSINQVANMGGAKCIIYPNPFDDYATVMVNSTLVNNSNITLQLFDLSGREVKDYILNSNGENNINTSWLSQGMYFYRLLSNNEVIQNGKLIKQ